MFKNKGIAVTFITIVSLITVALMGLLAVVITTTANTSESRLTASLIDTLKAERNQEEKLLRQGLFKKGTAVAGLLAQTGSSLIIGYDFDTLQQLADSAKKDPDVAAVVFFNNDKKPLTKQTGKAGGGEDEVIEEEVKFDNERIGSVKVYLNDDSINETVASLNSRIDKLVNDTNASLTQSSRSLVLRIVVVALIGVVLLCGVIYFCLSFFVIKPVTRNIADLHEGSDHLALTSEQLLSASHKLAEGSSEQAASIEETSSSLEEMASMTRNNEQNAKQSNTLMKQVNEVVEKADASMKKQTASMDEISKASEETSKIIKTIDEIAFQTNLLALNAAVEAARAGEAGAGFAVVADEVRTLAMRAAEAASNTATLIESTMKKVNDGANLVGRTNEDFAEVMESIAKVDNLIDDIAAASTEQTIGIEQVNRALSEIDRVTQENAAGAEETSSASEELTGQVRRVERVVADLQKLVGGAATENYQAKALGPDAPEYKKEFSEPKKVVKRIEHTRAAVPANTKRSTEDEETFGDF